MQSVLEVQWEMNRLIREATPKDNSAAPLWPLVELGQLVITHEELLNRALICYRQKG